MNLDNIRIVLVNTSHPGNIGGVARAMKNMGLSRLYLVQPRAFPHKEAEWRAASALDLLEQAVVTQTLDEAIGDCQFVVGTSARERRIPWPLLDPRMCAKRAAQISPREQVAVLFGREDRGLTNDELKVCNLHLNIPTSEDYSSLNLAMAVQIVCYEFRMLLAQGDLPATEDEQCLVSCPYEIGFSPYVGWVKPSKYSSNTRTPLTATTMACTKWPGLSFRTPIKSVKGSASIPRSSR